VRNGNFCLTSIFLKYSIGGECRWGVSDVMKLFKYLTGVVAVVVCCSVGSASSRIVDETGNTIPKNMKIDTLLSGNFCGIFQKRSQR
jgi:hypothetical protein